MLWVNLTIADAMFTQKPMKELKFYWMKLENVHLPWKQVKHNSQLKDADDNEFDDNEFI